MSKLINFAEPSLWVATGSILFVRCSFHAKGVETDRIRFAESLVLEYCRSTRSVLS